VQSTPGTSAWDSFREKGYQIRTCYLRTYFSVIYRGVRVSDGRAVAIKLLAPRAALGNGHELDQLVKKFAREVKALNAVRGHPGAVTLLESGNMQGWPYHVCEWVGGRTVADLLSARVALDLKAVLRISLDNATFIQWLHNNGLVHRDIAPDHVFVDEDRKTCLIDFGMAEFQDEMPLAAVRQYVGQDIRSIGLMLYEMWTGRQVFSYGRPILREEVAQSMLHLASIRPPAAVAEIIKRSIISGVGNASDDERPYRETGTLMADLRSVLAGLPDGEFSLTCSAGAAPYKRTAPTEGGVRDGV
jgi:tRNA A-37 threonylcarbamoyl transferase component Bud32